jgi:hypothetical protein
MKHYAFDSAKQSAICGTVVWLSLAGEEILATEITTEPTPSGKWDDYVSMGEVSRCIKFNNYVGDFRETVEHYKKKEQINFLDYVDCPATLISTLELMFGDKAVAASIALKGLVFTCIFQNTITFEKLYVALDKLGFTKEQIAREVIRQRKSRTVSYAVN